MTKKNETVVKIAQTALMAALCFVSFQFLQFKIVLPGGDATSFHVGNAFCVLAALILGGSGLYYRSAEDVCTEIMYRTYRRSCGS